MKDNDRQWKARNLLAPLPPTSFDYHKAKRNKKRWKCTESLYKKIWNYLKQKKSV
jgi:hypothetical protein